MSRLCNKIKRPIVLNLDEPHTVELFPERYGLMLYRVDGLRQLT